MSRFYLSKILHRIHELGKYFHFLDGVVLFLSLIITVVCAVFVYGGATSEAQVVIEGNGHTWLYPLNTHECINVPGPLGETVVEIHDGKVGIVSSPCKNQLCVAAGEIHEHGQWIACLPNGVFVRIEGKTTEVFVDETTW